MKIKLGKAGKILRGAAKIPESKIEADFLIKEIGELQVRKARVEQDMNEKIKRVRVEANRLIESLRLQRKRRFLALYKFYQFHKEELTEGGKIKLVKLLHGQFGTHVSKVLYVKNTKKALEFLRACALSGLFIRTKEEIKRKAILAQPQLLPESKEIRVMDQERFMVTPKETEEVVSESVEKLKKLLP